jgi:hypothetical protein
MLYPEQGNYHKIKYGNIFSFILNHEVNEAKCKKPPLKRTECSLFHRKNHAALEATKWKLWADEEQQILVTRATRQSITKERGCFAQLFADKYEVI